jgi:hypothetical protein
MARYMSHQQMLQQQLPLSERLEFLMMVRLLLARLYQNVYIERLCMCQLSLALSIKYQLQLHRVRTAQQLERPMKFLLDLNKSQFRRLNLAW